MNTTEPHNPDCTELDLGFLPLLDAAPLIVAVEAGFFAEAGLQVRLHREGNWASLRDKLSLRLLDGAHLLAPLVVASQASLAGPVVKNRLTTALSLGLNGNAITLSNTLTEALSCPLPATPAELGPALRSLLEERFASGLPRLVFGTVFPMSMHTYLLRAFFEQAGIDANRDIEIRVVPPQQMVTALTRGDVDGFCVGEPWNTAAVRACQGNLALLGYDIWPDAPEKVLAVHTDFAAQRPDTHSALISALLRACQWVDGPNTMASVAHWLSKPEYLDCDSDLLLEAMQTPWPDGQSRWHKVFYRNRATYPDPDHARWMLTQMAAARQVPEDRVSDADMIARAYQPALWENVFKKMTPGPGDENSTDSET
jgi:ABC-type nitrate/sulfonate/bicarbonate transport system substrate-binding protein